jgi:hypothetical protein
MTCLHNIPTCLQSFCYKIKKKPLYDYTNELLKQHIPSHSYIFQELDAFKLSELKTTSVYLHHDLALLFYMNNFSDTIAIFNNPGYKTV